MNIIEVREAAVSAAEEDGFWSAQRADAEQRRWMAWLTQTAQREAAAGNTDFAAQFRPGPRWTGKGGGR